MMRYKKLIAVSLSAILLASSALPASADAKLSDAQAEAQDVTIMQDDVITQDGAIMQDDVITQDDTITRDDTITQDDAITQYDGYHLTWNDEFDGKYLDKTKWRIGNEPLNGVHKYNTSTTPEGELENENLWLEDGNLQLQATDVEDYTENNKTVACNSGMVETYGKFSMRYGRMDVRAKLPVTKGMWPAIWMMPAKSVYGWPKDGEIDIMELISQEKNLVYGTIHCGTSGTDDYYHPAFVSKLPSGTFFDEYHLFSMEWDPGVIRLYVDQQLFATFDNWKSVVDGTKHEFPHPFNAPFYLKLNLAVGGSWCEDPDSTTSWGEDSTMSVDYVRVYKRDNPTYDYSAEAFLSASHLQGPVWYAQKKAADGTWTNMEQFQNAAWKDNGLEVGKSSMTPGSQDTAMAFWAPEDGYLKIRLKDMAKSSDSFQLRLTKGAEAVSKETLRSIQSVQEQDGHAALDTSRSLYLPVAADDVIRLEASSGGNQIEKLEPVFTYISEEEYNQAVNAPGEIKILGEAAIGNELSAEIREGDLSYEGAAYRWKANGVNIPYATERTFVPTKNEFGKTVTIQITTPDKTLESAPTEAVTDQYFVDDSDFAIAYTGFSAQGKRDDAENGTFHWSDNDQASDIQYTFTGSGIELLAYTHTSWTKRQAVTITDGQGEVAAAGFVDCSGKADQKRIVYSKKDLPYGTYTIHVTNDGTKSKIEFDGFYIHNNGGSTEPYPAWTLSFQGGDGAAGNPPEGASYSEGFPFSLPENPFVKEGFTFRGWSDGTGLYAPGTTFLMPDHQLSFTARWEADQQDPGGQDPGGQDPGGQDPGGQKPGGQDPVDPTPPVKAPQKTTGLKASSQTSKSIKLSWKAVKGADGYIVSRYNSKTRKWQDIETTSAASYKNTGLKAASVYRYRIRAYVMDQKTKKEGAAGAVVKTATAPVKTKLKAKRAGNSKIKLTWNTKAKADGFKLYMRTGRGSYHLVASRSKKVTSFTKGKLKKGRNYTFRLRSYKKVGRTKIYSAYATTNKLVMK